MENNIEKPEEAKEKLYTISEFRREVGIPLIAAKHLISWGKVETIKAANGTIKITGNEVLKMKEFLKSPKQKTLLFIRTLGPGFITGAADNDPSTIGTYSSVGAQFGLSLLWMAPWLLPLMMAVQEVCARIGIVTQKGLAGVLKKHYRKKIVLGAVLLLIVANVVNIGADLGAMAASLTMLTGISFPIGAISFAVLIALLEIFVCYHSYVKILKWLALTTLAYIAAGFIIKPNWIFVFKESFIPHISMTKEYIFAIAAVFGTTISPYLFFWQTSEEVEESKLIKFRSKIPTLHMKVRRMRTDVGTGIILANLVFFFIVLTAAHALFNNGITNINSVQEAASALRPFAGNLAYIIFAAGIIGTGLLAIPVLAGSGAYAFSEIMNWQESLEYKFSRAKGFYLVISFSIIVGLLLNFLGINPIKALVYSAFLNGIIAIPILIFTMIVGDNKKIMGEEINPMWVKIFGWLGVLFAILAIVLAVIFYII